jgi:hypothetical protein
MDQAAALTGAVDDVLKRQHSRAAHARYYVVWSLRAVAAGRLRPDIGPEDLLRALVGMCYAHDRPGWQTKVVRLVDVFIDGLCDPEGRLAQQARGAAQRPTT